MKNSRALFPYLIPLLFIFPLFKESISTFFFILVASNTIIYAYFAKLYSSPKLKKSIVYTMPFWIILIGCLLGGGSLAPVQNALYFLLFPLVFALIPDENFTKPKIQFYIDILKNTSLIIVVGYIVAFLWYYDFNDFFVFTYGIPKFRDFVYYEIPFFKIHPTYFTAILIFCSAYSLERVFKEKKYIELFYVSIFVLITFLLLTKINIVFIILLLFSVLLFRSGLSLQRKILAFTFLLASTVILLVYVPGISNRFREMITKYNVPPVGLDHSSTNIRVAIYTCSLKIADENLITGVGYNYISEELLNCYKENYNSSFYAKKSYLTHNYFMYILVSGGIFSFLAFLYYVGLVILVTYKINYFILNIFLLNILVICLSEDFFYRQFGLFYFSLIYFTFWRMQQAIASVPNQE